MTKSKKSVRLLNTVIPQHYTLKLKPDLEKFTFEGEEIITVDIVKPTVSITLHARELDIEVAEIIEHKKETFAGKISYNEKAETATFTFTKKLPKGPAKLRLVFRGILNDKLRGFYRSKYEVAGVEKHMATTQFESTDARRAFPCFDEPALKATFDVKLLVPAHTVAISNTIPENDIAVGDELREVSFGTTPKMSTYLLAFIIGEFEHIETRTKEGTLVRVFVTPGKKHQAAFALECAQKTLSFYNEYFKIPYPMPVLDLIAIPDFSAGAMENWGAITYRESALLVDPKHSSTSTKQWVALVIAHELAHQWFGNLVTMEWWTHLWLNEGFASYIEYLAVDKLFPSWNIWTQFAYLDQSRAFALDCLKHTHPIEVPVHHPDEIAEVFDEISYSKGASVIKMIADYLGEKDFRDGLRYYLKKHSYQNASTIHLWQAFEKISGKKVSKMMNTWTGKSGYPIVSVSEKNGKIITKQKRFFINPNSAKAVRDNTSWELPMKIKKGAYTTINENGSGFFRTNYTPEMLTKFKNALAKNKLPVLERLSLVRDTLALAEGGVIPTLVALDLVKQYSSEDNYSVWAEIAGGVNQINNILRESKAEEKFKNFVRELYANATEKTGWTPKQGEAHDGALVRSLLLSQSGGYGNKAVITHAQMLFNSKKEIAGDLRGVVYTLVAKNGGEKEYKKMLAMYRAEKLHEERNRIGHALGMFPNPKLLRETLAVAFSKDTRAQDSLSIIGAVFANPKGRDIAWEYTKKNWPTFLERYGGGGYALSRLVKSLTGFTTKEKYNDIKKFFKKHPAPGATRAVEQVLEKIDGNIAWAKRDVKSIEHAML